jgi:hypothetical protein
MPYVVNENDEEGQNPNGPQQGPVSPTGSGQGTIQLAPSGSVPTGGAAGAGKTPSSAGGSFASLDKYITANQGQAQPLANQLTAGINQQYNNLNSANNAAITDINNQVSTNATPNNYQDTLAQEAANPVSFASNPGNVASFQNLLNASYSGPASAEGTNDYQNQQNAINSAISTGQNVVSTEAGRQNLLAQNEATPTTGVTALNSAILSQSPEALNSVEQAYSPFSGLLGNLQSAAQPIDQQIAQNSTNATQANQASNQQIADQINGLNTTLQNNLGPAQTNANNAASAYNTLISNIGTKGYSGLNANQLASLGVTPKQAASYDAAYQLLNTTAPMNFLGNIPQPVTPASFVGAPTISTPTLANTATPDQYAQAQAFQNLLSGMNSSLAPVINSSTVNQAGTYVPPATTFNATGVQQEVANANNVANYLANYDPGLNSSNPSEYTSPYNPSSNYVSPSQAVMNNFLNQLKTYPQQGRYGQEQQAINDILNGTLS